MNNENTPYPSKDHAPLIKTNTINANTIRICKIKPIRITPLVHLHLLSYVLFIF